MPFLFSFALAKTKLNFDFSNIFLEVRFCVISFFFDFLNQTLVGINLQILNVNKNIYFFFIFVCVFNKSN